MNRQYRRQLLANSAYVAIFSSQTTMPTLIRRRQQNNDSYNIYIFKWKKFLKLETNLLVIDHSRHILPNIVFADYVGWKERMCEVFW